MAGFTDFMFGTADRAYSDTATRQKGYDTEYATSITEALQPYQDLTDPVRAKQLQDEYISGLTGLDTNKYKVATPTYDTSKVTSDEVQAMLDPKVKYQKEKAIDALESTAAGEGGLFSSGLGKEAATTSEELDAQNWETGFNRVLAEKNRQNQIKQQQFGTGTAAGTYNLGLDTTGINAKGTGFNALMEPQSTVTQGMMDLAGTKYGANTGISQQGMQVQGADTGYFGDILSGAVTGFKAFMGSPATGT